jgi:hypothetical protein
MHSGSTHILRISEVFDPLRHEILDRLGAEPLKQLGREFHLVRLADADALARSSASVFVRWHLPVDHSWPCVPEKIPSFIEKASQAMQAKFGAEPLQTILCGTLDPHSLDRRYKLLTSNLRGRALQLFPAHFAQIHDASTQDPQRQTLFALVGGEGLFCGVSTPQACGGFHPGGSVYIRQQDADGISRAGAKLAEALLMLKLDGLDPVSCHEWIELGASPGGMTRELLNRGCRVTAIDRAPLDPRLMSSSSLCFVHGDAASVSPPDKASADALLCDMNGDPEVAMRATARMADALKPGSPVIFTLKLTAASDCDVVFTMIDRVVRMATDAGLRTVRITHLNHNRQELTLILERHHSSASLTA